MYISYFDDKRVSEKTLSTNLKKLKNYREEIASNFETNNLDVAEHSLYHCRDFSLHETLASVKKRFKGIKYVILIGIGGQTLGVEAVHATLDEGGVKLRVLDTASVSKIYELRKELSSIKKVSDLAICVSSKSGQTIEMFTNALVVLDDLKQKFGESVYQQTLFIGSPGTDFMKYGRKKGSECVTMPEVVGGRYSIATAAGLVPLALLGHDVDEFITGFLDSSETTLESVVADSASRLAAYHQLKYHHYNFFAFETRLEKLGRWYRQLFAESLGKEKDINGDSIKHAMVPAISTSVELHSVGQLYMSGVPDVYTDFVTFDDEKIDVMLPKVNALAPVLKGYSVQEVATAIYGGVISAYQEVQLPYRATIFEENLAYSVGQFMGMRMREVMYTAHILKINAFNQPNVELYKIKTKEILGI